MTVAAAAAAADPSGVCDVLHVEPLYGRRAGWFGHLKLAFLADGRAIAAVRSSQTLVSLDTSSPFVSLPLSRAQVIYTLVSTPDGSDWSFPEVAPRAVPSSQGPPGLARSPDGHVYLVWMYGGGGRTRAGAYWSRTTDGRSWTEPEPITSEGAHIRGSLFSWQPYALDLAFTVDGTGWLIGQSVDSTSLRAARCPAGAFGSFGPLQTLGDVPWQSPHIVDLDSTSRAAPRLLATRYIGRDDPPAVIIAADESDLTWRVEPVPLKNREDAPFPDPFGGSFRWAGAAAIVGAEKPGVVFETYVDRLDDAAAWTTLDETWQLPQLLALDGCPGGETIWYVLGGRLRALTLTDNVRSTYRSRVAIVDGGIWPPAGLAIHKRDAFPQAEPGVNVPTSFTVRLPRPGFALKLHESNGNLIEEMHRPLLCAATVEPESLGCEIAWQLDGQPAGRGPVVAIDVRTEGAHVIEAGCGGQQRRVTITAAMKSPIEIVGGFSASPGIESEERDDLIVDLRKNGEE